MATKCKYLLQGSTAVSPKTFFSDLFKKFHLLSNNQYYKMCENQAY